MGIRKMARHRLIFRDIFICSSSSVLRQHKAYGLLKKRIVPTHFDSVTVQNGDCLPIQKKTKNKYYFFIINFNDFTFNTKLKIEKTCNQGILCLIMQWAIKKI